MSVIPVIPALQGMPGMPAEVQNRIATYVPSVAVNRDTADTCAPRGSEYRTRRDFDSACPPEASSQDPNSWCCTSAGPEESRRSSHEYLTLVHSISSLSNRGDWESLPFNFRRILTWLDSNNARFIPGGPRLRLNVTYPFVKDVVKLVIMLKSTAVIELFEKPDNSGDSEEITYATTSPSISDRDDRFVYGTDVTVYPQCSIFNDVIDAVKESRSFQGQKVLSVTVDLGSNFVPDIAPLPSLPYTSCLFAGSPRKPLDLQDVVDYGRGTIYAPERCIVTPTDVDVLDAFVFLLKNRAGGFQVTFKNFREGYKNIPEGYSPVTLDNNFVKMLHTACERTLPLNQPTNQFSEFKYGYQNYRNTCEVTLHNDKVATLRLL